jgi:hypothetical protein
MWFLLKRYTMKFNTNYICNMTISNFLHPYIYGIDCLLSNTMFIYLKGEIEFKMQTTLFITQHKQSGLVFFFGKVEKFFNYYLD